MMFNETGNIRLAVVSTFAGLMILLALWGGSPALAQEGFGFVIFADRQPLEVRNGAGEIIGTGDFRARVRGNRDGQARGRAQLRLGDVTYKFKFTQVNQIIFDENNNPIGVALSGRGVRIANGQRESFAATATVRGGGTTTIPDFLIWDIPGAPVVEGLNLDAEGTLRFRER